MSVLPLVMLLALGSSPSNHGPAGATVRWEAPPQCPDRDALLGMIDATLGEVSDTERHAVDVRGRLEASEPEGFVLRLELDGGDAGARELRGASCQELSEAAALLIAMAIDPRLLERQASPTTPGEPRTSGESQTPGEPQVPAPLEPESIEPSEPAHLEPSSSEPTASPAPPPVRATPREPLRFLGRLEAGVGGGPLPGAAAVLGLAAGLGGRGWRAELTAAYWTPRTRTSTVNPAIGVHAQLWALGVHGCGEPRWRTLSFPTCAGLLAGAVHARGVGELVSRTVASRWVAVALEPALVWWARPRLGLAVRSEGHVTLARPELRSDPSGTVFVGLPVGGSLRLGVELRLP